MAGRPPIAPGSLADRLRDVIPPGRGGTMAAMLAAGKALPEDVKAEVQRLRDVGYIRTYGQKRAMRYFWRP